MTNLHKILEKERESFNKIFTADVYADGRNAPLVHPEVLDDLNEWIDQHDHRILTTIRERCEEMKGEDGKRLNTFKEGHKDGYNTALTHVQELIDGVLKDKE